MDLDEEDYELLGYGDFTKPQKLDSLRSSHKFEKHDKQEHILIETGGLDWIRKTGGSKAVADSLAWRKKNPEKFKANNKRYRLSVKGQIAAAKAKKKYMQSPKGRAMAKAASKRYRERQKLKKGKPATE